MSRNEDEARVAQRRQEGLQCDGLFIKRNRQFQGHLNYVTQQRRRHHANQQEAPVSCTHLVRIRPESVAARRQFVTPRSLLESRSKSARMTASFSSLLSLARWGSVIPKGVVYVTTAGEQLQDQGTFTGASMIPDALMIGRWTRR